MKGILLFYLEWWHLPPITIEVSQLHAAILWQNLEMQLPAFAISALAYLRIQ